MNLIDTFLSDNPNFTYVSVVFPPYSGTKEYTYKTLLPLEVDDYVVVQTPNNAYQVCQVRQVLLPEEAVLAIDINYKWVVQKVDFEAYEACKKTEKVLHSKLRAARIRKQRDDIKSEALKYLSDEEREATAKLVRL